MTAEHFIDLKRYPIHGPERDRIVEQVRADLAQDGCAVLKGFLTPEGVAAITAEADKASINGHRSHTTVNPYFTAEDPLLAETDPRRQFYPRSNIFITADNFIKDGPLRAVHDHPSFDPFIQDCLQENKFHRYADPLADVVVNMAEEGSGFPWHFDTNNFTVTLAIQNAEMGGEFEYAPMIRTSTDECFNEVSAVLEERSDKVVSLHLEPGDLQLFKGRYSLHRVSKLHGKTPRYVAIFSYVEEPNMVGTPERTQQLYGRVLPIHHEKFGQRQDALLD